MSLSRNHHYIPRMYLSKWGKDNNIYVYRLLVSNDSVVKWEKRSVEHTGSLKKLYINIQNDTEYDTLEHFFDTKIDSPAKLALDKICSEEKMTSADWDKISDFVTAQWIRTPKFYIWTKDAGVGIILNGINEISKQISLKDISKEKRVCESFSVKEIS